MGEPNSDPFARHNYAPATTEQSGQTETKQSEAERSGQNTVSPDLERADASSGRPHVFNKEPDDYTLEDKVEILWQTVFGG